MKEVFQKKNFNKNRKAFIGTQMSIEKNDEREQLPGDNTKRN